MSDTVFEPFLNKNVLVETDNNFQVKGKLIYYKSSEKEDHEPFVLVLKAQDRFIVLRNWVVIKEINPWSKGF